MAEGKKVTILGAGFSGLVSAHFLARAGFDVTIHEAGDRPGGLIETLETPLGRIETAANGVLNSLAFESLCSEIGVELTAAKASPEGKKRFIFRAGKPRGWPLSLGETFGLLLRLPKVLHSPPQEGETVEGWALRVLGAPAYHSLLVPALQGIYAGDASRLDACLIFSRFFERRIGKKKTRPHLRGTVAPSAGMGVFIEALSKDLIRRGVRIHYRSSPDPTALARPLLIATSLPSAVKLLGELDAPVARHLARVEMLPLLAVSMTFPPAAVKLKGFGCLFARGEGFRSLGVLFENLVFPKRSPAHLERWILGGAMDREVLKLTDEEIVAVVLADRARMVGADITPLHSHVTRRPEALPHYTQELSKALQSREIADLSRQGIHLIGNYTGRLGLSGIVERAEEIGRNL